MKALKVMATINERGELTLDHPLAIAKNSRVEVIVLISEALETEEKEQTQAEVLEDFQQAWREAMTEKTIPVSQVWEELDDE